jgi:hypothetical protein
MFRDAKMSSVVLLVLAGMVLGVAAPVLATPENPGPIEIKRAAGPIAIDGDLSDAGWQGAVKLDTWFETNVGDNVPPTVENVAYLTYDDENFYAGFFFEDKDPKAIRARLSDRDNVPNFTDYGGVIVDPRGEGKVAQMFLANPRGIQYDAISSDTAGEDESPDFFWESVGKIGERGWTLEIRIPFSSLRYEKANPEMWRILLYRNHPRNYRFQYFTSVLPRDSSCFICNSRPLLGLKDLPTGSHYILAPYLAANQTERRSGALGSPLESDDAQIEVGLDAKWIPNPNLVIDATINPDFSQIEADAPQVADNERFALFYDERRPFFLENVDLFSTPLQAIYTRTFTSPRFGLRATGDYHGTQFTVLAGEDRGGGSVILPGSESSSFADQDFESQVVLGRVKRSFGKAFASFLFSAREIDGGGYNRVFGPDFEWRPNDATVLKAQLLASRSETPERPDLAAEWDGRELEGEAGFVSLGYEKNNWDFFGSFEAVSPEFRADNGFMPTVGYQKTFFEGGRSLYWPEKKIRRLRLFTFGEYTNNWDGDLLRHEVVPGFGLDAPLASFVRLEFPFTRLANRGKEFELFQISPEIEIKPGGILSLIYILATWGDTVDFTHNRPADGLTFRLRLNFRPTDATEVDFDTTRRTVDVDDGGQKGRLLRAEIARLRAIYTFSARSWLRLIVEHADTERNPELFAEPVDDRVGGLSGSLVFAYKLNWQTVLFVGLGDNQQLDLEDHLEPDTRQAFFKISYAFQR